MRVLVQRVNSASVCVAGESTGQIGQGVLLFAGFTEGDNGEIIRSLAAKIVNLRIFPDAVGRLNHSLIDVGGEVLAVPQFTLYASTARGRRPDFINALDPKQASRLFDEFVRELGLVAGSSVETGIFGADMKVSLENDGPFTLMLAREP